MAQQENGLEQKSSNQEIALEIFLDAWKYLLAEQLWDVNRFGFEEVGTFEGQAVHSLPAKVLEIVHREDLRELYLEEMAEIRKSDNPLDAFKNATPQLAEFQEKAGELSTTGICLHTIYSSGKESHDEEVMLGSTPANKKLTAAFYLENRHAAAVRNRSLMASAEIIEHIKELRGKGDNNTINILSLASGSGLPMMALAKFIKDNKESFGSVKFTFVDSTEVIGLAKETAKKFDLAEDTDVGFIAGNIFTAKLDKEAYDVVEASGIQDYLDSSRSAPFLAKISSKLLKIGGKYIVFNMQEYDAMPEVNDGSAKDFYLEEPDNYMPELWDIYGWTKDLGTKSPEKTKKIVESADLAVNKVLVTPGPKIYHGIVGEKTE